MTKILLAPCFGNSRSRKRYQATVEGWVRFEDDKLRELLTDGELSDLRERHPEGVASFWGARSAHDTMMAKLAPGDVVLFTGGNKVKAAAEVGVRFRNKRFGDKLWRYSVDDDSFVHVYSVVNVRPIERPKADLLSLPGFSISDPLAGQRYVRADQVGEVLGTFGIVPRLAEILLEEMVERRLRSSRITAV